VFHPSDIERLEIGNKRRKKLLSLLKNQPISIEFNSGTYVYRKNLIIGAGLGANNFEALLHELGHLLEIPDHRVASTDFGMDNDPGPEGYNWRKGLKREIKALAWESILFDYFKMRFPKRKKTIGYNTSSVLNISKTYNDEIVDVKFYCLDQVKKYKKKYSIRKMLKEWDHKMVVLGKALK
jgi:hypothetical protein